MNPESPRLQCPRCGGFDVRPSLTRRMVDAVMERFSRRAYRCRFCRRRFYEFPVLPEGAVEAASPNHLSRPFHKYTNVL